VETLQHKNVTLSDLLDLVTERAESTQKELDRCRGAAGVGGDLGPVSATGDATSTHASNDVTVQKEWEVNRLSTVGRADLFLLKSKQ